MKRSTWLLILLLATLPARTVDLSPGVVWPYLPPDVPAANYVATTLDGLLDQIEADSLAVSDPDSLGSFYYLPAPDGSDAWWVRFWWIVAEWKALPDTSRAKVHFRIW